MFIKFIHIPIFLISLSIGILFVYLTHDDPTIIYVYPTPDNIDKIQYKDNANTCFQFTSEQVKCPDNDKVKNIPAQTTSKDETPNFFKKLMQN